MFEIGWTEILFIAIVAIFVLKPKDYPDALRAIGNFLSKARQMAGEFQSQFNEAMRDANLDDVRKTIDEIREIKNMGPIAQVRDSLTQFADEATSLKKGIEHAGNPGAPSALAPDPYVGPAADPYTGAGPVDPYTGERTAPVSVSAIPTPELPSAPPLELMPPPATPAPSASETPPAAPSAAHGPDKAA